MLVRGSLFKVNRYDHSAHLVCVSLDSISHSPSDPVFLLERGGEPSVLGHWEGPGSPDGPSGLGWTSSARKACVATDRATALRQTTWPITPSHVKDWLMLAEGAAYIT